MELYHHPDPLFTKWVVSEGLLQEPFVVVDVGCQGGEHPRWAFLGDCLEFHGFDPIPEVIEKLRHENVERPNRHFYEVALGSEDGRRLFHFRDDPFSSSFYGTSEGRSHEVEIRKLDTLYAQAKIPLADHVKLDCEGFEPDILIGARQYLRASGTLSATVETNFGTSPIFLQTHFFGVLAEMLQHRLLVADYNFDRYPRLAYFEALAREPWPEPDARVDKPHFTPGAPATHNFLFCRDLVAEKTSPDKFLPAETVTPVNADQVIKAMINFELHGLMDWAYEHVDIFAHLLHDRLDVTKAKKLLLTPPPEMRYSTEVVGCLRMIDKLRELLAIRK
jgi:FkbM family methyltransferase